MKTFALRLKPGDDLRGGLAAFAQRETVSAGFLLSGIGSLTQAMIRFADVAEPALVTGPLEILTLAGTLSPDGAHLHIAVADASGQVRGGHLCAGSTVRTTAELVIGVSEEFAFRRDYDEATGYRELVIVNDSKGN